MEVEVDDNQVLHVPPIVLAKDEPTPTKIYSNFTIIPLLRYDPGLLDKQFYNPPATFKKPPALFHTLIKFLMDTSPAMELLVLLVLSSNVTQPPTYIRSIIFWCIHALNY